MAANGDRQMSVGIDRIALYAGRCYAALPDIVAARGGKPDHVRDQLMCHERSVYPPWEDGVTLAVNAARRLLTPEEARDVELVIVGTESSVDFGKPIATWVHGWLGLPSTCRTLEVKHACYGATGALKLAAAWVAGTARPGKKALVVATDYSRNFLGERWEYIGGGAAVAMLVGREPRVLELEPGPVGYFTHEISDTFRPTARTEVMNDETSVYSYLDALAGALAHYETQCEDGVDFDEAFARHVYHAPFPGMTRLAHRHLLQRISVTGKARMEESFLRKVAPGLRYASRIGSVYGASTFISLLGLLAEDGGATAGDRLSLFAYGSGCQGEFYTARIGAEARADARALDIDGQLDARGRLTVDEYEANERAREACAEMADFTPVRDAQYARLYDNQGLLVLDRVEGFHRRYRWS
jgi:hydroxymethylglutaryl-CoA synthase